MAMSHNVDLCLEALLPTLRGGALVYSLSMKLVRQRVASIREEIGVHIAAWRLTEAMTLLPEINNDHEKKGRSTAASSSCTCNAKFSV